MFGQLRLQSEDLHETDGTRTLHSCNILSSNILQLFCGGILEMQVLSVNVPRWYLLNHDACGNVNATNVPNKMFHNIL